jgi:hypothetical protein
VGWCNIEVGIVEEGVALEPLPREARGLDGLELPKTINYHRGGQVLVRVVVQKNGIVPSVNKFC